MEYTEGQRETMDNFHALRDGALPGHGDGGAAPPSPPPDIVPDALAAAAAAAGVPPELRPRRAISASHDAAPPSPMLAPMPDLPAPFLTAAVVGVPLSVAQDVLVGIALDRNNTTAGEQGVVHRNAINAIVRGLEEPSNLFTKIERDGFQDRALKSMVRRVSPKCKELQSTVKATNVPLEAMLEAAKCLLKHTGVRARANLSRKELVDMGECMHEFLIRVVYRWSCAKECGEEFVAPMFK